MNKCWILVCFLVISINSYAVSAKVKHPHKPQSTKPQLHTSSRTQKSHHITNLQHQKPSSTKVQAVTTPNTNISKLREARIKG